MSDELETIVQLRVSESLKRKIATKAFEADQTIRCFVLSALRSYGVDIDEKELIDRRKVRKKGRR